VSALSLSHYGGVSLEKFFILCINEKLRSEVEKQSLRAGTVALLEMLLAQEGETTTRTTTQFTFCLGADTFLDLTEWKWVRSHDVLGLLEGRIYVLYRVGVEGERSISLDELQVRVDHVNQTESAQVKLLRIETLGAVSSSLVRSCKDLEVLKKLVAPRVLEYIQEHRLYGFAKSETE
jgi:nicotinic acid mononucleotide adenylyltransferase